MSSSSSSSSWRSRHRQVALIALLPVLFTVTTATAYRVLHSVLRVERSTVRFLVQMHQGSWFGIDPVLFVCVNAAVCLVLVLSAWPALLQQVRRRSVARPASNRDWHRAQSIVSASILLWAAITGCGYRVLRTVFELDKEQIGWLIDWHHFSMLGGSFASTVYCIAAFSLLFTAIISGARMHPRLSRLFGNNPFETQTNL
jgi:hypothetical protein